MATTASVYGHPFSPHLSRVVMIGDGATDMEASPPAVGASHTVVTYYSLSLL